MSIGDVGDELTRIADGLPSAALLRAAESLDRATEVLARCAEGTGSDELPVTIQLLNNARQQALEAWRLVNSGHDVVQRYRHQIAAGDRGAPAPTSPGESATPRSTTVAGTSQPATARDPRVAQILARLPARTKVNPKTSGYWIDDEGQENGPMTSGRDEDYRVAVEELRALRLSPDRGTLFVTEHVEVKLAVRVRRSNSRRTMLVINNTPCAPGRYSCDKLMPQILRPGQELTVYWPGGSKTYTGRRS